MNKKKRLRFLAPTIVILLLVCAVLLVVIKGSSKEKLADRLSTAPALTGEIKPDPAVPLLTTDDLSLYLEENMVVRIESKDGTVWTTNGLSKDGKQTEGQFTVSYYNSNAAFSYMDSQSDSVEKDQAKAFLQDDTLYVQYNVGKYGRSLDDVPSMLSDARFQEKFISQLSAEEAELMQDYYKYYKNEDTWRIRAKGSNHYQEILEIMDKVGYTPEDLAQDNAAHGVETDITAKPWFTIVLAYQLTENGLSVTMPVERIEFSAAYPMYEVDLLPHFGLVEQNDEGYVLLPDGSGALMYFSKEYEARTEYTMPIYGLDWSVASDTLSTGQFQYEFASLPVFGMKDGNSAFLAVIEGGQAKATLNFHQAGTYFKRNAVYPTFRMVNKDSIYLSGSDNSSKIIVFESSLAEETCSVHYQFLESGSGYVEMAAAYRQHLLDQGLLTELEEDSQVSMLLETICGVWNKKNLLGVSYEGITAATTYEQNKLLAEDLLSSGVTALDLKTIGWFNDGVYHDYAGNIRLNQVLGGKSGWNDLVKYAEGADVGLYPDVDFQRIPDMAWGFVPTLDSAFRLDSNEAKFSILSRALLLEKEDIGMTPSNLYLLSPTNFADTTASFLKAFASVRSQGLSLRSTRAYSDFNNENMISRPETVELLEEHLKSLSAEADLLIENGAQYTFAYTQKMSGVSSDCSHYRIADESVPFLQMVLHGSMKLYTSPINLASNYEVAVLRAIEYGMLPNFQVTYEDSSVLKNSEYTDNYASGYESWRDDILETYAKINESLSGLVDVAITGHAQMAEQVYATTYATGDVVYVNYSSSDVTVGNVTVPAHGFYRQGGGSK